jgi:hypothetical protein
LVQVVADVQVWHPVAQGTQFPWASMKFLVEQTHWLSTVLVKEVMQVVQVLASTQTLQ